MSESYLASIQELYDSRASTYEDSWHPSFARHIASCAMRAPSSLSESPLVLDLACGTGLVTYAALGLAPSQTHFYGIDISDGMLALAKDKSRALPREDQSRLHFIENDITQLSDVPQLADFRGKFDVVICASALVLLYDPRKAIHEWSQWLKPGTGRLILDAAHPHNLRSGAIMETVATTLGIQLPYRRAWMSGEGALVDVVEHRGHFEIESIQLTAQTGEGVKSFDCGRKEADKQFERLATAKAYKAMIEDERLRKRAKDLFAQEWAAAANDQGKVEVVDGVYVAVARKT